MWETNQWAYDRWQGDEPSKMVQEWMGSAQVASKCLPGSFPASPDGHVNGPGHDGLAVSPRRVGVPFSLAHLQEQIGRVEQ